MTEMKPNLLPDTTGEQPIQSQENQETSPRDQTGEKVGLQIENIFRDTAHPIQVFAYEGSKVTLNIYQGEQLASTNQPSEGTRQPEEYDEKAAAEDTFQRMVQAELDLEKLDISNWDSLPENEKNRILKRAESRAITGFLRNKDRADIFKDDPRFKKRYDKKYGQSEPTTATTTEKRQAQGEEAVEGDTLVPNNDLSPSQGEPQISNEAEEPMTVEPKNDTPPEQGAPQASSEATTPMAPEANTGDMVDQSSPDIPSPDDGSAERTDEDSEVIDASQAAAPEAVTPENFDQYRAEGRKVLVGGQEWDVIDISPAEEVVIQRRRSPEEMAELAQRSGTIIPSSYEETGLVPIDTFIKIASWLPNEQAPPPPSVGTNPENAGISNPEVSDSLPVEDINEKEADTPSSENPPPAPPATEALTEESSSETEEEKTQAEIDKEKVARDTKELLEAIYNVGDEALTLEQAEELNTKFQETIKAQGFQDITELIDVLDAAQNFGINPDIALKYRKYLPEGIEPTSDEAQQLFLQMRAVIENGKDLEEFATQEEAEKWQKILESHSITLETEEDPSGKIKVTKFERPSVTSETEEENAEPTEETETEKAKKLHQRITDAATTGNVEELKAIVKELYEHKLLKTPITAKGLVKFGLGSALAFAGLYILATLALSKAMGGVKGGK